MSIFQYTDYRKFLKAHISSLPKSGHGEHSKIARALGVHSTLISLILTGDREITPEQGYDLAQYLQLTDLERDYFTLLIQFSRAGNPRYKAFVTEKIEKAKQEANKISNRFEHEKSLTEVERSIFYSSWLYSGIRLFISIGNKGKTTEEIQGRFLLPRPKIVEILNFLLSAGLIIEQKGLYVIGTQRTFLAQGSPHLTKHHSNWRIKSLQQADHISEKEMMFTCPISVSREDFALLREKLASFLKDFSQVVKDSPAEDVACLNIDFFWVDKAL